MASPPPRVTPIESSSLTPSAVLDRRSNQLAVWDHRGAVLTRQRWLAIVGGLTVGSLTLSALCLQFGATRIDMASVPSGLSQLLKNGDLDFAGLGTGAAIFLYIRLPRVLVGFLVGGSLASAGVALQALLRNPLGDPYVLGVSSGAALGVSLAMLFGIGTAVTLFPALPLFGFVGGVLSLAVIYGLAQSQGRLPIQSLLLAGVILNAVLTALIMFVTSILEPNRSAGLMAWLMGSLEAPNYGVLVVFAIYVLGGMGLLLQKAQTLNLLTVGEETARSLGIETERVKKQLFGVIALLTGAVVSVSGMIGFVGMVVPHAVRMVVGSDHRVLLPASMLAGGTFLVLSDTIARTMLAPAEIPVGIVTALAGGPLFLYLLLRRKNRM